MTAEYPRVSLYHTEERRLFSTTLGREYQLAVALPESYASSQQAYPVVYVLDGDLFFGVAAGLTPLLNMKIRGMAPWELLQLTSMGCGKFIRKTRTKEIKNGQQQ